MDKNGFFIGSISNFEPVILSSHEIKNTNTFVVGKLAHGRKFGRGMGMSTQMDMLIEESIKKGEKVPFIDPKHDYREG